LKKKSYFSRDTTEFLFLLSKHDVQYLIVGGEAVIYYGHPRLTGDIDLFYRVSPANVGHLFRALREFWDDEIPGIENEDELMQEGMIFQFGVPPNRIDLISTVEGVQFVEAWRGRKVETLSYGKKRFNLYYIGLDDLIKNKKLVGRNRDKDDLEFLIRVKRRNDSPGGGSKRNAVDEAGE
jgi:hypothetical protein